MAKAHPIELRERVVSHVEEGHTHRSTAAHFRVSIKFVNDMVKLKRETGHSQPNQLVIAAALASLNLTRIGCLAALRKRVISPQQNSVSV